MQKTCTITVTKAEKQIVEMIRALDYGEMRIVIKERKPIRVEEIRRSIQLASDK